jgi:hypothetical protein
LYVACPLDPVVALPLTSEPFVLVIVKFTPAPETGAPEEVTVAVVVTDWLRL